jgi:glutamyl-Q tRNA(Asp) synthetase
LTAVASYVDARAHGGRWLVRIEDVDTPRVVAGADQGILHTLAAHGMVSDAPPVYQSDRRAAYDAALSALAAAGHVFYCRCSRSRLRGFARYPGTCRAVRSVPPWPHAVRLRVPNCEITFIDHIQGRVAERIDEAVGDFVIRRRDGLHAYQLAVVVDDAWQHVTHIVRGADLLDNTPRQILLSDLIGLPRIEYAHVPILINRSGAKLSKQTLAAPVDDRAAAANVHWILELLGHEPPAALARAPVAELLTWAQGAWTLPRVPRQTVLEQFIAL